MSKPAELIIGVVDHALQVFVAADDPEVYGGIGVKEGIVGDRGCQISL